MKIINMSTNHILSSNAQYLHSLKEKSFGLLNSNVSRSLVFKTRFGIHTFGLKVAIDVIILDSKYVVKNLKANMHPNELFFWNPRFDIVMELPMGTIKKTKTKLGNILVLK